MKPNHKGRAQIFENPVLERLTRTHVSLPISIFIVIATGLIYYGITHSFIGVVEAVGLFFTGWLLFSLLEYVAHRFFSIWTRTRLPKRRYSTHFMATTTITRKTKSAWPCRPS